MSKNLTPVALPGLAVNNGSRNVDWVKLVKRVVARFARGNISAQHGRILTAEEREREHAQALKISKKMQARVSGLPK
jgi:hypothetical protein